MQHFCRLTLGAVGIKTQADQKPILFRQTFQHLGQADLIRKFFLRGFHRDIYLPVTVLPFRGQAQGGLCSLDRKRDVLHALPQLFCQLRKGRLGAAELPVMFPRRIDPQSQFF